MKTLAAVIIGLGMMTGSLQSAPYVNKSSFEMDSLASNFERNLDSLLSLYYVDQFLDSTMKNQMVELDTSLIEDLSNIPDSVFKQRIDDIPAVVDLSYNQIVRRYIEMYLGKRRELVETMLGLSNYYFPVFDEIFDYHGVPNEMKYMSIIESALNPRAVSSARASCSI